MSAIHTASPRAHSSKKVWFNNDAVSGKFINHFTISIHKSNSKSCFFIIYFIYFIFSSNLIKISGREVCSSWKSRITGQFRWFKFWVRSRYLNKLECFRCVRRILKVANFKSMTQLVSEISRLQQIYRGSARKQRFQHK